MANEAAARGTTVYLVDKRINMLAELLGTNLCSVCRAIGVFGYLGMRCFSFSIFLSVYSIFRAITSFLIVGNVGNDTRC